MSQAPPTSEILTLLSSLSNPTNHDLHTKALQMQAQTLSASPITYSQTCVQFARTLATISPDQIPAHEIQKWSEYDLQSVQSLQNNPISGWSQMRQMAGILLKNALLNPPIDQNTKTRMRLLNDASTEIKQVLCQGIVDSDIGVRRVSSGLIARCTVGNVADGMDSLALEENKWGEIILGPFLINCLESAISIMEGKTSTEIEHKIQFALFGALQTLANCLEDNAEKFERGIGASFNKIVPALLKLLQLCGDEKVKVNALKCCNHLVQVMPGSLIAQMNDFLGVLSMLANDKSSEVRKLVCRSIVSMLSFRPEYLKEHMLPISQFILNATGDENEDVALEACEYWLVFSSLDETLCTEEMVDIVGSLLPHLLPTLVKSMVYPEEKKIELLDQNDMDERQNGDRTQDVAPVFHKSKSKGGTRDDDNSDEDEGDGSYDEDKEWSLRTCAAASLDSLASGFGSDKTFPYLLPLLEQYLSSSDPWVREAGILALGAIEEGCGSEMNQHMHQLHPFLMNQVVEASNLPQLVCISCWTLGRYASWAVEQTASGIQPELINNLVNAIIGRVLDKNRKVQVASVSALCVLIENAGDMIIPFLDPIYRTLVLALEKHSTRSLLVTLETFGSIAMTLGEASGEGYLPSVYVPPLIRMWFLKAKENPLDRSLLPLLESLSYVTMCIGMSFQPWALETFDGALSTINACMMVLSVSDYSDEEADTIVCAVDLIDGLVEGLGVNFEQLVSSSNQYGDHFLEILRSLVGHDVESVRTSAFALMGDIAKHSPVILQDGMEILITEAISCIDPMYPSCCNNAVWALGEILVKCRGNPALLQPYASEICQNLIIILAGSSFEDEEYYPMSGLVENAATTLGRLSQCEPSFVAEDLHRLFNGWIDGCAKISDTHERCDAFSGLLLAIEKNPHVMHPTSPDISDKVTSILFAIVSWHIPEKFMSSEILHGPYSFVNFPSDCESLQEHIRIFLHKIKDLIGPELWINIYRGLPINVRKLLKEQYGFLN